MIAVFSECKYFSLPSRKEYLLSNCDYYSRETGNFFSEYINHMNDYDLTTFVVSVITCFRLLSNEWNCYFTKRVNHLSMLIISISIISTSVSLIIFRYIWHLFHVNKRDNYFIEYKCFI